MRLKKLILLLIFSLFIQNFIFGQNNSPVADSINNRFNTLISSSNTFQDHKVIKISQIQSLRNDIRKEISTLEEDIQVFQEKLEAQKTELSEFQEKLTHSNASLEQANASKDQLSLLGMTVQKSTYNSIIMILIFGLLIGLFILIYKYKRSNRITIEVQDNLLKNEEEFAAYKENALKTQQKLGRQIMDERNKSKNDFN